MAEEQEEKIDESLGDLPKKNIGIIFITTFFLVYVFFTMVDPSLACKDGVGTLFMTGCQEIEIAGNFFVGMLIAGGLFLFDMTIVYMTLGDYFM